MNYIERPEYMQRLLDLKYEGLKKYHRLKCLPAQF